MSQLPNAWEEQRYNGHDGGEDAIREALKDPGERLRWRQAELAERILEQIRDNLPVEDVEGAIQQHVEDSRGLVAQLAQHKGPRKMSDRIPEYKGLRPPVIEKLIREGEVANLVSESKVGKSWEANHIAILKATGGILHNRFCMDAGPVLYCDNELHEETSNYRFLEVGKAMGLKTEQWSANLYVQNFRGQLLDINGMGEYFLQFEPGQFKLIFIDAGYRALQQGADENSNSDMTVFYNLLDRYAMRLGCAIVVVHHSTKGSQGQKRVTDVGSGAGSQSRAADSHIVLRAHQEDGVFVYSAALRSNPPIQPFCVEFKWPLWIVRDDLDPAELRTDRPRKQAKPDREGIVKLEPWTAERFVGEFVTTEPAHKLVLVEAAVRAGLSERKAEGLFKRAVAAGLIHAWQSPEDRRFIQYASVKQPEQVKQDSEESVS